MYVGHSAVHAAIDEKKMYKVAGGMQLNRSLNAPDPNTSYIDLLDQNSEKKVIITIGNNGYEYENISKTKLSSIVTWTYEIPQCKAEAGYSVGLAWGDF